MSKTKPKTSGRPKGAKTQRSPEVSGELTRCPKCDSTERGPYLTKQVQVFAGIDSTSKKPFTAIVRRRTRCVECGQHRIDRHFVFSLEASKKNR